MKLIKITLLIGFILLFFVCFAFGFYGNSTDYNIVSSISSIKDSNYLSNSPIVGIGETKNYLVTFGNLKSNISQIISKPEIQIVYPVNNSELNISKREIKFVANFNKKIAKIKCIINGENININSYVNQSKFNTILPINYGKNKIYFVFKDIYGITNEYTLYINTTLKLNGTQNDIDGDGINNSEDNIIGNISNIYTNINLSLKIDNSSNE